VFDDYGIEKPTAPYIPPLPRTKDDCVCLERFWRDEALGVAIARELMESFYRQPQFLLPSMLHILSFNTGRLSFLLNSDLYALGYSQTSWYQRFCTNFTLT
jgi:hypothetical protein